MLQSLALDLNLLLDDSRLLVNDLVVALVGDEDSFSVPEYLARQLLQRVLGARADLVKFLTWLHLEESHSLVCANETQLIHKDRRCFGSVRRLSTHLVRIYCSVGAEHVHLAF